MTDWGDAILNEKARPRTWVTPPPEPAPATRAVPRPQPEDPPLTQHDKGVRIIPGEPAARQTSPQDGEGEGGSLGARQTSPLDSEGRELGG